MASCVGNAFFNTSSNDEPAVLQDVLHVPRIFTNLLLVYRITKQGYGIYFDSSVLEVVDTNSLQIVASGTNSIYGKSVPFEKYVTKEHNLAIV